MQTEKLLLQETVAKTTKRLSDSGTVDRRPAKKQRRESSTSNSNRVGSVSPTVNHSSPTRKTGLLLDRPANIARPVSNQYYDISFSLLVQEIYLFYPDYH